MKTFKHTIPHPDSTKMHLFVSGMVVCSVFVLALFLSSQSTDSAFAEFARLCSATLNGAYLAFLGTYAYGCIKERRTNHKSFLQAYFQLLGYYQKVVILEKNNLKDLRKFSDIERAQRLVYFSNYIADEKVDISSLSFVLSSEEPDLLNRISLANNNFWSLMDAVSEMNSHRRRFEEKSKLISSTPPDTKEKPVATFVPDLVMLQYLIDLTKVVFDFTPKREEELRVTLDQMVDFGKRNFKGLRVITYKDI